MLEQNITRYIWTHTRRQQIWMLVIIAISMVPYFLSFNLPKQIVNGPIQGVGFAADGATQLFMRIAPDLPWVGKTVLFPGVPLDRLDTLFALSGVFLALVIVNGLFKYYINIYKGKLGERLLRRLRFTLVDHILRFPPATFRRLKGAELSSMVKDEVEPLGGFAGDAFVAPALLGGQALTAMAFIFVQSVPLGLIAAGLVGVQVFIIPRMRRRLLILGRERQLTARELSGRVSEIVDGINTIHAYDTSNYERADIAARLGRIYQIRSDIYQWKFLVKFINNFLASVTPFLFYSVGGYLALNGQLDVGQLVAVIAAYRDLPGPMKELIDWDQNRQDVQVKYQQVIMHFTVDGILSPHLQALPSGDVTATAEALHPLATVNLGVVDDSGAVGLDRVNFTIDAGETVAVVGGTGAGSEVLADALARIVWPTSGKITAGGRDLHTLPESVTGRSIGYAGTDSFFFFGTLRDNLLYGLKHAPVAPGAREGAPVAPGTRAAVTSDKRQWDQVEAARSGNPDFDVSADWIDHAANGFAGRESLMTALYEVFDAVLLTRDVLELALRSKIDPVAHAALAEKTVAIRQTLRDALTRQNISGLIVPFEPGTYNAEASVLENLLFGRPRTDDLMEGAISRNAYFQAVLEKRGLRKALLRMGTLVARNTIELFGDLAPDNVFLQQLMFMTVDEIPDFQKLLRKLDRANTPLTDAEQARLIALCFDYVELRHRMGLLTGDLMAEIVAFRADFHAGLSGDMKDAIELYDPARYMESASLQDNMLFGRISQKYRDGAERIQAAIAALMRPEGIYEAVLEVGLDFHVGAAGKRLTATQRQKASLVRALIRRSDTYVFNRPLSTMDTRNQEDITRNILAYLRKDGRTPAVVWVASQPGIAALFDRVAVFESGNLVEDGTAGDVAEKNGVFNEILSA